MREVAAKHGIMKQTSLVSNPGSTTSSYVNLSTFFSLSELHLLHTQNGHNKPKLARSLETPSEVRYVNACVTELSAV